MGSRRASRQFKTDLSRLIEGARHCPPDLDGNGEATTAFCPRPTYWRWEDGSSGSSLLSHAFFATLTLASSSNPVVRANEEKGYEWEMVGTCSNGRLTGPRAREPASPRARGPVSVNMFLPSLTHPFPCYFLFQKGEVSWVPRESVYLVDPASSHMLVSKIKPCKCQHMPPNG